jgi:hypothetical protein
MERSVHHPHSATDIQTSARQTSVRLARRKEMADEKSSQDFLDRKRLSVDEYYEVEHFARENGVSPSQVSKLIKKNGNDRMTLTQAVRALRDRK